MAHRRRKQRAPTHLCPRCNERHVKIIAKRRVFAETMASCGNATTAAKEARYAHSCAKETAYKLMQRVEVKCYIASIIDARTSKLNLDGDWILRRLKRIAEDEATPEKKKIEKTGDRIKALELLGKNQKLFTDVTRIEGDLDIRQALDRGRKRAKQGGS